MDDLEEIIHPPFVMNIRSWCRMVRSTIRKLVSARVAQLLLRSKLFGNIQIGADIVFPDGIFAPLSSRKGISRRLPSEGANK